MERLFLLIIVSGLAALVAAFLLIYVTAGSALFPVGPHDRLVSIHGD